MAKLTDGLIYTRPPIIEAVIGITFAQPIKESVLATADRRFAKHYPAHQDNNHVNIKLNTVIGTHKALAHSAEQELITGHRRMSTNMDEIAVLLPDSLLVSQLAPYHGWDAFVARFKRDLALYKRPGTFREISRVGVRYINRIDIPASGNLVEHEPYLNLYPRVPDQLGPLLGYAMQSTFNLGDTGCQVTINSGPVASPTLGHASFVVDIDIYTTTQLPKKDAEIFALLHQIRVEKNRIFEACVTQRARAEIFGYVNS